MPRFAAVCKISDQVTQHERSAKSFDLLKDKLETFISETVVEKENCLATVARLEAEMSFLKAELEAIKEAKADEKDEQIRRLEEKIDSLAQ